MGALFSQIHFFATTLTQGLRWLLVPARSMTVDEELAGLERKIARRETEMEEVRGKRAVIEGQINDLKNTLKLVPQHLRTVDHAMRLRFLFSKKQEFSRAITTEMRSIMLMRKQIAGIRYAEQTSETASLLVECGDAYKARVNDEELKRNEGAINDAISHQDNIIDAERRVFDALAPATETGEDDGENMESEELEFMATILSAGDETAARHTGVEMDPVTQENLAALDEIMLLSAPSHARAMGSDATARTTPLPHSALDIRSIVEEL